MCGAYWLVSAQHSGITRRGAAAVGPREATRLNRGLEHLFYEKSMRELCLLSLERERIQGSHAAAFQYLNRHTGKMGSDSSSVNVVTGHGEMDLSLKERRFRPDLREKSLY